MVIGYWAKTWNLQNFKMEFNGISSTHGVHQKSIKNSTRKTRKEVDASEMGVGGRIILHRMFKSLLLREN